MSIFCKEKQIQKVIMVPLNSIIPNKSQPRTTFDESAIYTLSQSIKENGIIQPVSVRKKGAIYEIISGERRCRASKLAGLTEIPCIVMDIDDECSAIYALIENIQRSNLSFFEEAIAIDKLITEFGLTQQEAARRLGKAQSTIANKLRLLKFTDAERTILIKGNLSERQARAIIRINDESERSKVLFEVIRNSLNLEQTETVVNRVLNSNLQEEQQPKTKRQLFNIPLPKVYFNSINKIVCRMKDANIHCETVTSQSNGFFEYTIRVPVGDAVINK